MNEIELKEKIIEMLRTQQRTLDKYDIPFNEDFARGFISGAESMTDLKIPSHWYREIINKVQSL